MASISKGPDFLARVLASIEDETKRVEPGEEPPSVLASISEALAECNTAAADAASITQSPAEATLTITIKVKAAPSRGQGAHPATIKAKYETKKPKYPVVESQCHIDKEGNLVEKEMKQRKLRGVDDDDAPRPAKKTNVN